MIGFDEAVRLARIQERVRVATFHELKKDGHHKSSEGATSISFNLPAVVGDEREPYWAVEVYSYVLGPNRQHTFIGKSAAEAIAKAEDAVEKWCFAAEMEMFERACGIDPDGPDAEDAA